MTTVSITITKAEILKSVESLLWKYGKAIEGVDNYKQVYNTHSQNGTNNVDARVLGDSYTTRVREVADIMRDFVIGNISDNGTTGVTTITLSMPTRWSGLQDTLQKRVNKYVVDCMMFDWLTATAPAEAPMYGNQIVKDEQDIKVELYAKGRP